MGIEPESKTNQSTPLYIIGAGGLAREMVYLIADINRIESKWDVKGFIDSDPSTHGTIIAELPVLGSDNILSEIVGAVVLGMGDPRVRFVLSRILIANNNLTFPNLIHPTVSGHWDRILLGQGNLICAGSMLTTDINIGSFNLINLGVTIGHDCAIEDACVINPSSSLSGNVYVENSCLIGTGVRILQNLRIGASSVVAAGSIVTRNVVAETTVSGSPARKVGLGQSN